MEIMAPISFYPAVDNPEYFHVSPSDGGQNVHKVDQTLMESGKKQLFEGKSTNGETGPKYNRPDKENENERLATEKPFTDSDSDCAPEVPPRSEQPMSLYVNTPAESSNRSFIGDYVYTKSETSPKSSTSLENNRLSTGSTTVICSDGTTSVHNILYCSNLPHISDKSTTVPLTEETTNFSRSPTSISKPNSPVIVSNFGYSLIPKSTSSLLSNSNTPILSGNSSLTSNPITSVISGNCSLVSNPNTQTISGNSSLVSNHSTPAISSNSSLMSNHNTSVVYANSNLVSKPTTPVLYTNLVSKPSTPALYTNSMVSTNAYELIPKTTNLITKLNTPPVAVKKIDLSLPETPAPPVPAGGAFMSDNTLQNSLKKKKKVTEARVREEEESIAEKLRLDEILAMCAEYDKQVSDSPKNAQSPYHTLPQNRIKTNGSLPREKRSPSYSGSPIMMGLSPTGNSSLSPISHTSRGATPEDEMRSIFSNDVGQTPMNSSNTRTINISNYPPFPLINSPSLNISPPSIHAISPYENVSQQYSVPHSPRTRIRTIVGKERKDCEIFENKMATGEFNAFSKISKNSEGSPVTRTKSLSPIMDVPLKLPRAPRMESSILNEPFLKSETPIRSVITNKYFNDDHSIRSNSYYDTPKNCHDSRNFHTIHYSNPSSLPVKALYNSKIDCKIKNKVFEEQMIKNIKDSLNVHNVPEEIKRLKEEQNLVMELTAELRRKIDDLERQENEFLIELEIERALLEAELATIRHMLAEDEQILASLRSQSESMDARHKRERNADQDFIQNCKNKLESAEESLEKMEWKNESFHGTTDEETEMLELLKSQHESVEAERKLFEDTEFGQMESEAQRENEREELNKEINDLLCRISEHKDKICDLEFQMTAITVSVCEETDALETQRQQLLTKIGKERMRLASIGRQFGNLERLGVTSSNGQISPCSSGSDESCAPELAEKLAKLHLLDRSQEDLDLINQVTTSSPLGYADLSLGRKTSATLLEIEKNRHLLLAKKGSLVIDSERKRVEELKQRVADEVKAQWEERKSREQREVNCTSLNSVGSEESSLPSSDVPTESLSSDDVQRGQCDSRDTTVMLRQRDKDLPSDDSMRPVSDASSFCDVDNTVVRLRRDKSRTQRPLTRYLPVRAEMHFDLRQHIETAGHQLDQCPHVVITTAACRGHLCKLSSKFKAWQKRWFVFDRSKRALLYYGDKAETKTKGGACFQDIEEVYVDHQNNKSSQNLTFCVKTHQRIYHLMARSPEAMRIWIDVIFTGAEGYREFQTGT